MTIKATGMIVAIATIEVIVMIAAIVMTAVTGTTRAFGTTKAIATIVQIQMSATSRGNRDRRIPHANGSKGNPSRPAPGVIGLVVASRDNRNTLTETVPS